MFSHLYSDIITIRPFCRRNVSYIPSTVAPDGADDRFAPGAPRRVGRLLGNGGRLPSPALALLPPGLRLLQTAG